jgi:hypothetical protein
VDIAPVKTQVIEWISNVGAEVGRLTEPMLVLPATSIKGALRHRATFHARRLNGQWASRDAVNGAQQAPPVVDALFGSAKERADDDERGTGFPGRLTLSDLEFRGTGQAALDHVCLDRFTGGPMAGMLFSEAPAFGHAPFTLEMWLDTADRGNRHLTPEARTVLRHALLDLAEGRLALGGGSNRGHGFFKGSLMWATSEEK